MDSKYWTFLSYRHADNKTQDREWASWLQREIERYEVPVDLVGTLNSSGEPIPERIYPVFRDESSLSADADLVSSIEGALKDSRTLVVLCTPRATQSRYVAQEIQLFIESDRRDRIVPVLVDGEPGSQDERECLPAPLLSAGHPIIAADFRLPDGSEGYTSPAAYRQALQRDLTLSKQDINESVEKYEAKLEFAKLQIIAAILGISLRNLQGRDKAYQLVITRSRVRRLQLWLTAMAAASLLFGIGGIGIGFRLAGVNLKGTNPEAVVETRGRIGSRDFVSFSIGGICSLAIISLVIFRFRRRLGRAEERVANQYSETKNFPVSSVEREEAFSSQSVVRRYPAPVAISYLRFRGSDENVAKLNALFLSFEALVRFLAIVGICDLFASTKPSDRNQAFSHDIYSFLKAPRKMTFGKWVGLLREVGRDLKRLKGGAFVEPLAEIAQPGGDFDKRIAEVMIKVRNDLPSHPNGLIHLGTDKARELVGKMRPLLEQAMMMSHFLRLYPLGFVREDHDSLRPSTDRTRPYILFSGVGSDYANREPFAFNSELDLESDMPFVVKPDGNEILYLWPLLLERTSPVTQRPTLYGFEKLNTPFLSRALYASIDSRDDPWYVEHYSHRIINFEWLWKRADLFQMRLNIGDEEGLKPKQFLRRGNDLSGFNLQSGKINLIAKLGTGGFGSVYFAENQNGEKIAVKVMDSGAEPELKRFQQEFERLKQATSPYVIRCLELNEDTVNGRRCRWYSMEYAHRGDLTVNIQRRSHKKGFPWLDKNDRLEILNEFEAILQAVVHLHQLDIVHRDLKPSNILVMEDGSLKVSDFGLVKKVNASEDTLMRGVVTSTGAGLGTWTYMAPEQAMLVEDVSITKACDIYSLGVIFAELVTSQAPDPKHYAKSGSTLNQWHSLVKLPEETQPIIFTATSIDPAKRIPDVFEFLSLIQELRAS